MSEANTIVAVVPATGHEALVAYGKAHPWWDAERPTLLVCCVCGAWDCTQPQGGMHHRGMFQPRALVLYAPSEPRFGMVRAMDAAGLLHQDMLYAYRDPFDVWFGAYPGRPMWMLPHKPPGGGANAQLDAAFVLAHFLLHEPGKVADVLVLPLAVPA